MTFIIQCPYPDCSKFMLLEDADRGSTVKCLVCKKPVKLDPSSAGETPAAAAAASGGAVSPKPPTAATPKPTAASPPAAATAQRQIVRTCTKCNTPLKVPAGAEKQRIRCPRCQNVF